MKCKILHELPGRMRVHAVQPRMTDTVSLRPVIRIRMFRLPHVSLPR